MTDDIDMVELERDLERSLCTDSFGDFATRFWPVVTGMPLVPNRATSAVIEALQSVADGKVWRLLIAIAPGTGKSTLLALFAAWRLARNPGWRAIHGGHAFDLAATESRRVRRLVESDDYRSMFPRVVLRADENTVALWATTSDGRYYTVGADTSVTGKRAHELVLDDAMNANDRHSKAARDHVYTWFTEGLSSRLDGDRAPIVVVMQRLDRDDLIGRLIESGGWTLLELPAESDDGELLAPQVLPREKLDALKAQIGAGTYATQFLQRPSDDSSATIKRSYWRWHHATHVSPMTPRPSGCDTDVPAVATPTHFSRVTIAVDLTFGSKTGDFAVAQVWGAVGAGRYLLAQWRKRAGLLESVAAIKALVAEYPHCRVIIERAANGAGAIEELAAAGLSNVIAVKPLGSKAERIGMVSATIEAGNALLPLGASWVADFVEELAGATKHDDAQDCAAYALHDLNTRRGLAALDSVGGFHVNASMVSGDGDADLDVPPTGFAIEMSLGRLFGDDDDGGTGGFSW